MVFVELSKQLPLVMIEFISTQSVPMVFVQLSPVVMFGLKSINPSQQTSRGDVWLKIH